MRFSFRQLEYFVAAGETGSVTRAAQGSHSSQPTVSAAIAKLEASLGVQLFVRHHAQGLSLTPEGRRFLGEAKALLRHASERRAVRDRAQRRGGRHARPGLPGDAGAAGRAQPGARVPAAEPARAGGAGRVAPGRAAGAAAHGALERRADLRPAAAGATSTSSRWPSCRPTRCWPPTTGWRCAERRAGGAGAREPHILLDLPLSREYFLQLFGEAGLEPNVAQRSEHPETIRTLVANGFGYAIVNALPAHRHGPGRQPGGGGAAARRAAPDAPRAGIDAAGSARLAP